MKRLGLTTLDRLKWLKHIIVTEESIKADIRDLSNHTPYLEISNKRLSLLIQANQFKMNFYSKMKKELVSGLNKKDFLSIQNYYPPDLNVNPFTFKSLIRDWGSRKEYNQREIITSYIKNKLQELSIPFQGNSIFLGCGNGGYVVDFAGDYDNTYAFDNSLPMIWSILFLSELREWEVLQKIEKNCRKISDTVIQEKLSITEREVKIIKDKIRFSVEDLKELSIESASINHIYSIYFTDVLPLKILFEQLNRILQEKGLFIHFGPLDYFFTDEVDMLTTEEIVVFFKEKNYTILVDEYLPTRHLYFEDSMKYQTYDNWFFIAQKSSISSSQLKKHSRIILSSKSTLNYEIKTVNDNNFLHENYIISNSKISYFLPKVIYEMLKKVDSQKDIDSVLQSIDLTDLSQEDMSEILKTLQELYNNNLIKLLK